MMKNKNIRKKTLTAVGAVVAAGLTPGIIAATPSCLPVQDTYMGVTAAEVVVIDGMTYSFDELLAMQRPGNGLEQGEPRPQPLPQHAARYGAPGSSQHATYYGEQHPSGSVVIVTPSSEETMKKVYLKYLTEYCAQLIDAKARRIRITPDSDLAQDLGMTLEEMKELSAEIKRHYGVETSYFRFRLVGQLNTLRLISDYIYKMSAPK
jgi:hypothetical protein